jgi:hypothetical protein
MNLLSPPASSEVEVNGLPGGGAGGHSPIPPPPSHRGAIFGYVIAMPNGSTAVRSRLRDSQQRCLKSDQNLRGGGTRRAR